MSRESNIPSNGMPALKNQYIVKHGVFVILNMSYFVNFSMQYSSIKLYKKYIIQVNINMNVRYHLCQEKVYCCAVEIIEIIVYILQYSAHILQIV
jgi:hypothetical protein